MDSEDGKRVGDALEDGRVRQIRVGLGRRWRQVHNSTTTRHGSIKSISRTQGRETDFIDLSTAYWFATQRLENTRLISSRKSTRRYLKHHAVSTHQSHRTSNPRQRSQGSQQTFPLRHRPKPRMESRSSIHETPVRSYFATCDSAPFRDGPKKGKTTTN